MSTPRLSHGSRQNQILDAACSLIEEFGVAAMSMSMLARRAKVSRAWIYKFYPDIESILMAVYDLAYPDRSGDRAERPRIDNVHDDLVSRLDEWMQAPVAAVLVGLYAKYVANDNTPSSSSLHRTMVDRMERFWIEPFSAMGLSREEAWSLVVALDGTLMTLRLAVAEGHVSAEHAVQRARQFVDALFPTTWSYTSA